MVPNLALRWITLPGLLLFTGDCIALCCIVLRLERLAGPRCAHPGVRWLWRGAALIAAVVASCWILSFLGCLGRGGFLGLHAASAALLLALTKGVKGPWPNRSPGPASLLFLCGDRRRRFRADGLRRLVLPLAGWLLVALLLLTLALAIGVFAVNWDSQTYRLSRVGYWLQEHRISMDFANDARLRFMPVNAELFMLWLVSFFPIGYPLANLAQYLGGCLVLLSVFELGRLSCLSREARLAAALLVAGTPVVVLEMATSQSDLFTAGLLCAGLVFGWRSLRSGSERETLYSGAALGLAFGAKSSLAYWVPGIALWFAFLCWRHRVTPKQVLRWTALTAGVAALVGGWKYADNWVRFGNPFAPPAQIARIHDQGGAGLAERVSAVAASHLWQLAQPDSNPRFLGRFLGGVALPLGDRIEARVRDPRLRASFRSVRDAYRGDLVLEDVVSFGLLLPVMACMGIAFDLYRRIRRADPGPPLRLAMSAAVAIFLGVFFMEMNLNPWNYRYFVTWVPFVAVAAAAALPFGRSPRFGMICLLLIALFQGFTVVDLDERNCIGGVHSLFGRPQGTDVFETLARQVSGLDASVGDVGVALPENSWLSPYFRVEGVHRVQFFSVESLGENPRRFMEDHRLGALVAMPDAFSRSQWASVDGRASGLSGPFAAIVATRR